MNKNQAAKKKAEWMAYCLDIGFCDKSQLDELSAIWDKYKDENGNLKPREYAQQQLAPAERFKMPNDRQIIGLAILYNDGKVDKKQITNMVAMCQYVLDRLYENGDILIPSSKEPKENEA